MGIWQPIPGAVTGVVRQGGPKRLQGPMTVTAEGDEKLRAMAAEGRGPMAKPAWKPESTVSALGRPVETREEYNKILAVRGLTETSPKNPGDGVKKPKVDIDKIQREAFALAHKEIAEGRPVNLPKPGAEPLKILTAPPFGSMQSMFEDAKRRAAQTGQLVGGPDTGIPEHFAFTEPKSFDRAETFHGEPTYDAMATEREGQARMIERLVNRNPVGLNG